MINEIIDTINNQLDEIVAGQIVLGLTQRVYRSNGDESIEFMPGIVGNDGEAIYAGIDDIQSLTIYHKVSAANLSFAPRGGYGDAKRNEDTITLSLIAGWDTRKVPLQAVDMLLLLRSRLPQSIRDVPNMIDVQVVPQGAILNTKQIFDSEYSIGENYLLPMYINFIQLNYSILIKYDQQCIDKCINCSN